MGKSQRDKGARSERNLVHIFQAYHIPAKRVPLSGATTFQKGDIIATINGEEWQIESKVRADGFKQLYQWLEGNHALIVKADFKESLIVMPLKRFCELVGGVE